VLRSGAHTPRREILGSKYPRKYISSTTGPAIPFAANPKVHVMSRVAAEERVKSSAKKVHPGNQENTFSMRNPSNGGKRSTAQIPHQARRPTTSATNCPRRTGCQ
jgi:hypothetical protein